MACKLLFTLVCDDARIEQSGKILVVGLYNYLIGFRPASPGPAGQNVLGLSQLCLVRRWLALDTSPLAVETHIIDKRNGRTVLKTESNLAPPAAGAYSYEILALRGVTLSEGIYSIETRLQTGEVVGSPEDILVKAV